MLESPPRVIRIAARVGAFRASLCGLLLLEALLTGCSRREAGAPPASVVPAKVAKSTDCRACHEPVYQSWSESHHAHAHGPVEAGADAAAFAPARSFSLHGVDYQVRWEGPRPELTEQRAGQPPERHGVEFVLGYTPLRQYVIPAGGGRYQMTELAFDPAKQEWFNVFGN